MEQKTIIKLYKDEFQNDVWVSYCNILGIDEDVANRLESVELEVSKVRPKTN